MNEMSPDSAETSIEGPPARRNRRFTRDVIETLGLALLLFLVINLLSARVRVEGSSMLPTLDTDRYVLVSRLTPRFSDLKRGDIIVFRPPMYPEAGWFERLLGFPMLPSRYEDYIKRVIGLPGEVVTIQDGVVTIDGLVLEEPYIYSPPSYEIQVLVPADHIFVLGDNRNSSSDSHSWGSLPIENVLGKAVLIYFPFSEWEIFESDQAVLAAP
jgi:signal peptidase I